MRTVNISYLYLEGDTEGSADSNRVRCMTYAALPALSAGGCCRRARLTAGDGMNPLPPALANGKRLSKREANTCTMETGKGSVITLA